MMSEHDVPAERGRDELRERLVTTLATPLGVQVNRAIAEAEAALAPQEAPAEGISLSAQLSQAAAWMRVWDECQRLGMDTYGAPSTSTGLDIVLDFIRGRAAPQEAREPDIEALAEAVHDAYLTTCARLGWDVKPENRVPYAELSEDSKELDRASVRAVLTQLAAARPAPETREPELLGYVVGMDNLPARIWLQRDTHGEVTWCAERINDDDVEYVRAPASGEPSGAEAAVREALDAIKKAHAAVDDLCDGRRWTMSIPARPDADPDLVIGNALTKAERVIRSLTDVPTAPGAPEEGRCGLPSPVRRYGPCILRRGHGGPGAHQHDETGRIMQAYHAPGYYRQWAEERQREWAEEGPDTSEEGDAE